MKFEKLWKPNLWLNLTNPVFYANSVIAGCIEVCFLVALDRITLCAIQ